MSSDVKGSPGYRDNSIDNKIIITERLINLLQISISRGNQLDIENNQ